MALGIIFFEKAKFPMISILLRFMRVSFGAMPHVCMRRRLYFASETFAIYLWHKKSSRRKKCLCVSLALMQWSTWKARLLIYYNKMGIFKFLWLWDNILRVKQWCDKKVPKTRDSSCYFYSLNKSDTVKTTRAAITMMWLLLFYTIKNISESRRYNTVDNQNRNEYLCFAPPRLSQEVVKCSFSCGEKRIDHRLWAIDHGIQGTLHCTHTYTHADTHKQTHSVLRLRINIIQIFNIIACSQTT